MAQSNLISINIPESDINEINAAIKTLKTKLLPHLVSLSSDQKRELLKTGDKTVAFVEKALEYCIKNSDLVPAFIDVEEYKKDVDGAKLLRSFYQPLLQITEQVEDAMALAGSEAYNAGLIFYKSLKAAMTANAPNAETIYDDLSNRFQGKGKAVKNKGK